MTILFAALFAATAGYFLGRTHKARQKVTG